MKGGSAHRRWLVVFAAALVLVGALGFFAWRRLQRRTESVRQQASAMAVQPWSPGWMPPPLSTSREVADELVERARGLDVTLRPWNATRRHALASLLEAEWQRLVEGGRLGIEEAELRRHLRLRSAELEILAGRAASGPLPDWTRRPVVGGPTPAGAYVSLAGHRDLQLLLRLWGVERLAAGEAEAAERALAAAWRSNEALQVGRGAQVERHFRKHAAAALWLLRRLPEPDRAWRERLQRVRTWDRQVLVLEHDVAKQLRYIEHASAGRAVRWQATGGLPPSLWNRLPRGGRLERLRAGLQNRCFVEAAERGLELLETVRGGPPCGSDLPLLASTLRRELRPAASCPHTILTIGEDLPAALTLQAHLDLTMQALLARRYCAELDDERSLAACLRPILQATTCRDDWTLRHDAAGRWEIAHAAPERLAALPLATSLPIDAPLELAP